MQIDVVSCLRSAPAEGSVLPAANAHDTNSFQRPAFLKVFRFFFIWIGYFHTMLAVTLAPSLMEALWIKVLRLNSKSGSVIAALLRLSSWIEMMAS